MNCILAGVGGQGTVLASKLIAQAVLSNGLKVRTAETIGILSREHIALLRKDALVINVGRGTAIDQDALVEALNEERIAGAGLDVMDPEPLPADDPLWSAKNLVITPHISGNLTLGHTCRTNVAMFCEDIANYAAGRPLVHLVDRTRGY